MSEDSILRAKIGLLEVLVRMLLKNECRKQADPIGAMEGLYERLKRKFEERSGELPKDLNSEEAALVFLENFEIFFDQIRMDLRRETPDRKS